MNICLIHLKCKAKLLNPRRLNPERNFNPQVSDSPLAITKVRRVT